MERVHGGPSLSSTALTLRMVPTFADLHRRGFPRLKENRSYYGATSRFPNESNLDAFERAVDAVKASGKDIPVVSLVSIVNGMVVPAEFEADSDAIVVGLPA